MEDEVGNAGTLELVLIGATGKLLVLIGALGELLEVAGRDPEDVVVELLQYA